MQVEKAKTETQEVFPFMPEGLETSTTVEESKCDTFPKMPEGLETSTTVEKTKPKPKKYFLLWQK